MKSTSARKSIPLLPRRDFNAKLIALESRIFVIYTENKAIAAGFLTLYDNTGYYYYSGTDTAYSSLMAAYLLQWEMILYAKSRKAEFYDFLGISPAGAGETHYLSSVSSFKKRFGGMRKSFAAPWVYIKKPLKYFLLESFRAIRRPRRR
jgi:lipid II:glycine glycyltransferase (peptidoglycan interpeptide bridge formation enzyme)